METKGLTSSKVSIMKGDSRGDDFQEMEGRIKKGGSSRNGGITTLCPLLYELLNAEEKSTNVKPSSA